MTLEMRAFIVARQYARGVTNALTWLSLALFVLGATALSTEIVMRYGFNRPLSYVHEATSIAFVYIFLMGAAVVYVRQQEVSIDFLAQKLSPRQQLLLMFVIHLTIAVAALLLTLKGFELAHRQMRASTPSLNLPRSVYGGAIVLSGASFVFFSTVEAWGCTLGFRKGGEWSVWPARSPQDVLDEL